MKPVFLVGVFVFVVAAKGATQVLPPTLESVEGSGGIRLGLGFNSPSRTQVVYGASLFSNFASEGGMISVLRFRTDGGPQGGPFSSTVDLEIRMSTTLRNESGLSATYASNPGSDEVIVLPRSQFVLSSSSSGAGGPRAFDAVIPLPTQFKYVPTSGNLLIDFLAYEPGTGSLLDSQFGSGDGIGFVQGSLQSTTGTLGTSGFILQLEFQPIPEPMSFSTIVVGIIILILRRKHELA